MSFESKNFQLEKFDRYSNIFCKSSKLLSSFREQILLSSDFNLELSVKADSTKVSYGRFTLSLPNMESLKGNIVIAMKFMDSLEKQSNIILDKSLLDIFIEKFDILNKAIELTYGLDISSNAAHRRVKLYFSFVNYMGLLKAVVKLIKCDSTVKKKLLLHNTAFMLGFDFGFDGTSRLKLYYCIDYQDYQLPNVLELLNLTLPTSISSFVVSCKRIELAYNTSDFTKGICLHPYSMQDIVYKLEVPFVSDLFNHLKKLQFLPDVITLYYNSEDIITGMNIYF